jgi:hypothetical protein
VTCGGGSFEPYREFYTFSPIRFKFYSLPAGYRNRNEGPAAAGPICFSPARRAAAQASFNFVCHRDDTKAMLPIQIPVVCGLPGEDGVLSGFNRHGQHFHPQRCESNAIFILWRERFWEVGGVWKYSRLCRSDVR